jgi:acetyl coenzyme A synthetase (ADP forming)-like protein
MHWKKMLEKPKNQDSLARLDYLFYPKNVAVIGASNERDSVGYAIFENFVQNKNHWCDHVFAVNPNHAVIQNHKAYKRVVDIPVDLDLCVIVVPAQFVASTLTDCIEKKVETVIIISAGFSEIGEKARTEELRRIIAQNPATRVVGPNCFGILTGDTGLNTTFSAKQKMNIPKNGSLAFLSQSGALGLAILDWASTQEFGVSKFVSYGNAMDLDESDFLEYFGNDPKTRVITAYLEGVKNGPKFLRTAATVSAKKPILILKGGVTEQAHAATLSHTGSMAGASRVYEAAFRQTGCIQAATLQELFHFAKTFETEPLMKGPRVQIITNGGGYGILTADQVIQHGLSLAKLSPKTVSRLKKEFPKTVTVSNPMDLVGDADEHRYEKAVQAALSDPAADAVLCLVLFSIPAIGKGLVSKLAALKKTAKKPLVVAATGSQFTENMRKELEKQGIPTYKYPEIAAASLSALWRYSTYRKKNAD